MPLNTDIAQYFATLASEVPPFAGATPTVTERRTRMDWIAARYVTPVPSGVSVRELSIDLPGRSLPARLYRPQSSGDSEGKTLPLLVYYHGGGWVVGNVDTHHALTATLAQEAGLAVLSVLYRKAPEHVFPAPCDDAYEALVWAHAHAEALGADPDKLAVGGDSAGAHLATGVALRARDDAAPNLAFQLLLYPCIEPDFTTPSMAANANGPGLTANDMAWYWRALMGVENNDFPPLASPALTQRAYPARAERLQGLPPAYIVTAEYDPLKDDGERYAALLKAAGVPVEAVLAEGLTHGFARQQGQVPAARAHVAWAAQALKRALA